MPLNFVFDRPQYRKQLTHLAKQGSLSPYLLNGQGCLSWNGALPERAGDYFYREPWVLCSEPVADWQNIKVSVFGDNEKQSVGEALSVLANLAKSVQWAIFPWGGNAAYGMLGHMVRGAAPNCEASDSGLFQYKDLETFAEEYHGLIGRRKQAELARVLWQALHDDGTDLLVITFEYYEDAFVNCTPTFSVEGTISDAEGSPDLSVYRIRDFKSFEYFVGMINAVKVFQLMPGNLSLDSCQEIHNLSNYQDFSAILKGTPWFLVCNEGEIDTYPLLFVSSIHEHTKRFESETRHALRLASFF